MPACPLLPPQRAGRPRPHLEGWAGEAGPAPRRHGLPRWELLAHFPKPRRGRAPAPTATHSLRAAGGGEGSPGARWSRRERGAASPLPLSTSAPPPAASRSRCRPRPNPAPALQAPPPPSAWGSPRTWGAWSGEGSGPGLAERLTHSRRDLRSGRGPRQGSGPRREGGPLTPSWGPGAASGLVVQPRRSPRTRRPGPGTPPPQAAEDDGRGTGRPGERTAGEHVGRGAARRERSTGNGISKRRERPEGPRATHHHMTTVHLTKVSDLLLSTFFRVFSNLS